MAGPDQGLSVAHTRAAAGGDDQADLLREAEAFGEEIGLFGAMTVAARRGPGRPPGSPNRSTLALKRLLLAKGYRDPAEFLAAIISHDTRELAAALRPDQAGKAPGVATFDQAHEAMKLQVRAAEALLPYFHQKMPIAVEHSGGAARPVIIINDAGFAAAARVAAVDGTMSVHESVEDQGVSGSDGEASHG